MPIGEKDTRDRQADSTTLGQTDRKKGKLADSKISRKKGRTDTATDKKKKVSLSRQEHRQSKRTDRLTNKQDNFVSLFKLIK